MAPVCVAAAGYLSMELPGLSVWMALILMDIMLIGICFLPASVHTSMKKRVLLSSGGLKLSPVLELEPGVISKYGESQFKPGSHGQART